MHIKLTQDDSDGVRWLIVRILQLDLCVLPSKYYYTHLILMSCNHFKRCSRFGSRSGETMAPGLNSQPEINRNDEEWEELYTIRPANHHFKQAWGLLRVINMSLQFIQTWTWTWCRPWTWIWTWVFALLLSLKTRPFQVLQDQHQTSKQGSRSDFRWPPNNQNIGWHCLWRSTLLYDASWVPLYEAL